LRRDIVGLLVAHYARPHTEILTVPVVARALNAGDLVELPLGLPDRPFHALRHKERYRTRAADALTDLIKEQSQ